MVEPTILPVGRIERNIIERNMHFTMEECNLLRQWYNAVEDAAPEYITQADKNLMQKIALAWGDTWRKPK